MNVIPEKLSSRKIGDILGSLATGFGVSLFLEDYDGRLVHSVATACDEQECMISSNCCNGRTLAKEPLHFRERRIGELGVCMPPAHGRECVPGIARCLESFLELEGEIDNLSSEIVRLYEILSLIHKVSGRLGSEMDIDTICHLVLEEADKVLAVYTLFIMLLDPERNEISTRLARGRDADSIMGFRMETCSGLIGHVLRQGVPVTVRDVVADGRLNLPYPAKTVLCVPLIADAKPVGMLIATDKLSGEEFWSQELQLMGIFAPEVASTLRKAFLYEEINTLFLSTVKALATAIDAKDPYTYGHSRRVAELSVAICNEMGLSKDRVRALELASLLHDIGKIGTPESILRKPGRLQDDEYEKIKEHPATGAEILSTISEFKEIITWIRHHHEWYDGEGYPDRIAAEDIPLEARIITIADAFDAMTSDRPYRKGMPTETVMKIMEQFNRSQFDPVVLQAFSRCIEQGKIA